MAFRRRSLGSAAFAAVAAAESLAPLCGVADPARVSPVLRRPRVTPEVEIQCPRCPTLRSSCCHCSPSKWSCSSSMSSSSVLRRSEAWKIKEKKHRLFTFREEIRR